MISDLTAFISFLAPLAAAAIGCIYIISNRNKSIAKSFLLFSLISVAYKSLFDFVVSFNITGFILPSYAIGNFFVFSCAPFLYLYFKSLVNIKSTFPAANNLKHFILPAIVFLIGLFLIITVPANQFIAFLNMRFEKGILDKNFALYSIFYTFGFPLLIVQWSFYVVLLTKIMNKRRRIYSKYYGTLEQRNSSLIQRIFAMYLGIFFISFILSVFKVQSNLIIFLSNAACCTFIVLAVLYGNEQLNMQKYRMYKLSSHEEEIAARDRSPSKR